VCFAKKSYLHCIARYCKIKEGDRASLLKE
jgi:hypothetical protein